MSTPSDRLKYLVEWFRNFEPEASTRLVRTSRAAILLAGIVILLISTLTIRHQKDFSQDYFAAQALLEGSSIYSRRVVELGEIFNGRGIENAHPPSLVLTILPVALLPYPAAFLIFTLISVLVYVAALHLASQLLNLCGVYQRLLIATSLLWPATLQSIHQGSISFLIASLTILGWVSLQRGRSTAAAAVLGIATALKFFPGILIFHFIIRKDWRGCLTYLASFSSLALVSLIIFGWDDWRMFITTIAPHVSQQFSTHYANVSIWAYLLPWVSKQPYLPPLFENHFLGNLLMMTFFALLAAFTIRSQIAEQKQNDDTSYSYWLWALCSVLFAPVSWQYSLTFLPVPIAILLKNAVNQQRTYLFGTIIITCIMLTLADYDSYSLLLKRAATAPPSPSAGLYFSYLLHTKIQATGVLVLFGILASREKKQTKNS